MIGFLVATQKALARWPPISVQGLKERAKNPRFWVIQLLAVGISGVLMVVAAANLLAAVPDLYLLTIFLYFIPVAYAGLNLGFEEALPTALWCCLLAVPNVILFGHGFGRLCVMLQLGMIVVIAAAIAYWIERETVAKRKAESSGARLAQLNATATATSGSLRLEEVLSDTVAAILASGNFAAAWIAYSAEGWGRREVVAMAKGDRLRVTLPPAWEEATRRALLRAVPRAEEEGSPEAGSELVVPVLAAGAVVGALGVAAGKEAVTADDRTLLAAIGRQLGLALDNIHSYRKAALTLVQLAQTQETLQQYIQMATVAQEEERQRLARELHDDTLQSLVIAKTSLDTAAHERNLPDKARVRLTKIQGTMEEAIDNVRRFSRDLRPSLLDHLGLVDAIEWLVEDTSARTGVDARLDTVGSPGRIESRAELAAYRIVQEALRNMERHAQARHCRVRTSYRAGHLTVLVLDDGRGFDVAKTVGGRESVGFGLRGMQERARLAHASMRLASRPGRGTLVALRLMDTDSVVGVEGRREFQQIDQFQAQ